jgi:hypothetical protein
MAESTLRGQINAERSPSLNDVLDGFSRWPVPIRVLLLDLFGPSELDRLAPAGADPRTLDHNSDGRVDLDDAFDACMDAAGLGQDVRRQLRNAIRQPRLASADTLAHLVGLLRRKRDLTDCGIAVLQHELTRRQGGRR